MSRRSREPEIRLTIATVLTTGTLIVFGDFLAVSVRLVSTRGDWFDGLLLAFVSIVGLASILLVGLQPAFNSWLDAAAAARLPETAPPSGFGVTSAQSTSIHARTMTRAAALFTIGCSLLFTGAGLAGYSTLSGGASIPLLAGLGLCLLSLIPFQFAIGVRR